jgi:dGTPase
VGHSPELQRLKTEVETFLHGRVYYHPRVQAMKETGQSIVKELYAAYTADPDQMPGRHAGRVADASVPRVVCDYLAGMTDRFARAEHSRLYPRRRPV